MIPFDLAPVFDSLDWQSDGVIESFWTFLENDLFVDVVFVCGGCDEEFSVNETEVWAHRAVIAAFSPALRNLFQEHYDLDDMIVVVVPHLRASAVKTLLDLIYTGRADWIDNLEEVAEACVALDVRVPADVFERASSKRKRPSREKFPQRKRCKHVEVSELLSPEVTLEEGQEDLVFTAGSTRDVGISKSDFKDDGKSLTSHRILSPLKKSNQKAGANDVSLSVTKVDEKPMLCIDCGVNFRSSTDLVEHMASTHLKVHLSAAYVTKCGSVFRCNICQTYWGSEDSAVKHCGIRHEKVFAVASAMQRKVLRSYGVVGDYAAVVDDMYTHEKPDTMVKEQTVAVDLLGIKDMNTSCDSSKNTDLQEAGQDHSSRYLRCPDCGVRIKNSRVREHLAGTHLVKKLTRFVRRDVASLSFACTLCEVYRSKVSPLVARHCGLKHNKVVEVADERQKEFLNRAQQSLFWSAAPSITPTLDAESGREEKQILEASSSMEAVLTKIKLAEEERKESLQSSLHFKQSSSHSHTRKESNKIPKLSPVIMEKTEEPGKTVLTSACPKENTQSELVQATSPRCSTLLQYSFKL